MEFRLVIIHEFKFCFDTLIINLSHSRPARGVTVVKLATGTRPLAELV